MNEEQNRIHQRIIDIVRNDLAGSLILGAKKGAPTYLYLEGRFLRERNPYAFLKIIVL